MKAKALIVGAVSVGLLATWLSARFLGRPDLDHPQTDLTFVPTAAQARKIEDLQKTLGPDATSFARTDVKKRENAKLFMYMAGTSEDERVVQASLAALTSAYVSRGTKKEAPDRDLDRVLIKHLSSTNSAHAQAAFAAARIPLMTEQPSAELTAALVSLASENQPPGRRTAALSALDLLRPGARPASVLSTWLESASGGPPFATLSLLSLSHSAPALAQEPALAARLGSQLFALTRATNPGLRGLALGLAADPKFVADTSSGVRSARAALADPHPYVRGVAAAALGDAGRASDIRALMALAMDDEVARFEVQGLVDLDGSPFPLRLSVPGRRLVAEAALMSVAQLGEAWAGHPVLRLNLGAPSAAASSLREAAARARAFYEANEAQLSAEPAEP